MKIEEITICKECYMKDQQYTEIQGIRAGEDDYLDYCPNCQLTEGQTKSIEVDKDGNEV